MLRIKIMGNHRFFKKPLSDLKQRIFYGGKLLLLVG